METETKKRTIEDIVRKYATPLSIIGAGIIIAVSLDASPPREINADSLQESVIPKLSSRIGTLGICLIFSGRSALPIKILFLKTKQK